MVASQIGHLEAVMTLIVSGSEVNHTDKVVNRVNMLYRYMYDL